MSNADDPSALLPQPPLPEVTPRDMWLMLLSTVRYALGRSTYIVSEACNLVHRYRPYLTQHQILQVEREVSDAIVKAKLVGDFVGMKQDHDTWMRFVEELRA